MFYVNYIISIAAANTSDVQLLAVSCKPVLSTVDVKSTRLCLLSVLPFVSKLWFLRLIHLILQDPLVETIHHGSYFVLFVFLLHEFAAIEV